MQLKHKIRINIHICAYICQTQIVENKNCYKNKKELVEGYKVSHFLLEKTMGRICASP